MIIPFLLIFILLIYIYYYSEKNYIKSTIDNNIYISRIPNKSQTFYQQSANTLAEINTRIIKLIKHLEIQYQHDTTFNYIVKSLKNAYSHKILSEASIDSRYTTFTINKKEMHICLRKRNNSHELYDINILMYVILHELAHMCNYDKYNNPIIGHGPEFKRIFQILVSNAIKIGIYTDQRFNEEPKEYCDLIINSNVI